MCIHTIRTLTNHQVLLFAKRVGGWKQPGLKALRGKKYQQTKGLEKINIQKDSKKIAKLCSTKFSLCKLCVCCLSRSGWSLRLAESQALRLESSSAIGVEAGFRWRFGQNRTGSCCGDETTSPLFGLVKARCIDTADASDTLWCGWFNLFPFEVKIDVTYE